MSTSDRRNSNLLQTPEVKNHLRVSSRDRFLTRSIQSTNAGDFLSAEKSARYSLSYLPGAVEHTIETGKTLAEAQMKVVIFACEVERLSSQNYELVKENEVLRTQTNKSEREKDLETKLAIVLAENEKLNHIIEDVYNTYMTERGSTIEVHEQRLTEALQELEQWKQRYGTLPSSPRGHDVESALKSLEEENKRLNEVLTEKDRDVETLRARLEAKGASEEASVLEEKILWLVEENTRLKEGMKGSDGQERLLKEYRDKLTMLLAENDNLSEIIKNRLQAEEKQTPLHEVSASLKSSMSENVKMASVRGHSETLKEREELKKKNSDIERLTEKLSALLVENDKLNVIVENQIKHIEELENQQGRSSELFSKTELVTSHNEHLNNMLLEKVEENEKLKKDIEELKKSQSLHGKVRTLLDHNDELNNLVLEKVYEVKDLRTRLSLVGEGDSITEELKNKLLTVSAENEKLNRLLITKIEEVEKIRRDLMENGSVQRENGEEAENLRKRVKELEAEVQSAQELRSRFQLVTLENERLNSLIGHQLNEGEQTRKKLSEIDHSALKMQEMTRTIDTLRGENERLNRLVMEKHSEVEQMRTLRNDSMMHSEAQTKLMLVTQENQRLDTMIIEKIAELERAKTRIMELEGSGSSSRINKSVDKLVEENEKLSAALAEQSRELETLRVRLSELEYNDKVIAELKIRLQAVLTENEKLNNIAMEEARENKQLANKMGEMSKSAIRANELSREVEAYKSETERLNRIVVEKTVEIERLVMNITELQSVLSDLKAKLALLSTENERLNSCVFDKSQEANLARARICELEGDSAKVTDLEGKLVLISSENQRLLGEIENLKARVAEDRTQDLEVRVCELLRDKDALAIQVENLQAEVQNMNHQHVHVINTLSVNLERHQEELKKAGTRHQRIEEEIDMKNRHIAELQGDIETMKKALDDRARTIEELEEKVIVKIAEKERLELVAEEKCREVEAMEKKVADEMRKSQTLLAEELECEKRRSACEREELERHIEMLKEENKRLQSLLNQTLAELEEVKARYQELETIRAHELDDFRAQFETLKQISREIKELQVKTAAERAAYETQLAQNRMVYSDLELQRDLLATEIERLTALNVQRLEESEKSKRSVIEIEEVHKLEVCELKSQIEQYKANSHDIKQLALKYSADKAADQSQINQLRELNDSYKAEIKKLYELLEERKTDIESMHHLNEELRQSQSQFIVRFRQETETGDVISHEKLEDLQIRLSGMEKAKDEYRNQAERNSIELTRRNSELVDKIQQLDVLKMKYEEAFANYQALNSKLFERLSVEK